MEITLKAARINKGLNQYQAANEIGVSKYTLSNWERGLSFPDVRHIQKIENVYGVSYDSIIFLLQNNA